MIMSEMLESVKHCLAVATFCQIGSTSFVRFVFTASRLAHQQHSDGSCGTTRVQSAEVGYQYYS